MVRANSKKTFLCIHNEGPSDATLFFKVYEYKNGKLKVVGDLAKIARKFADRFSYASIQNASKNKWTVRWRLQSSALGSMTSINVTYKVTSSGIKRLGKAYSLRTWNNYTGKYTSCSNWTARQNIAVYKTKGGSKVSYYIRKGEKVDILKISGKNGHTWFQVRNSQGKKGWLKEPDFGTVMNGYFEECMFAG